MPAPPATGPPPSVEPSPLPTLRNAVALAGVGPNLGDTDGLPRHVTNEQFQAMIPAHFNQPVSLLFQTQSFLNFTHHCIPLST